MSTATIIPLPEITPEAFLSLQQSQTFYGTPSNLPEIEPDDPRLEDPNQCMTPPHVPISPLAVALDRLGMNKKAKRVDRCGITRRFRGCDCRREGKQSQTCMCKSCRYCSKKLLQKRVDKFFSNMRYIAPLNFFFAIVITSKSQKDHPAKAEIQDFKSQISAWIKQHSGPLQGTGAFFFTTIEQAPDGYFFLSSRILWWWDSLSQEARDSAPGKIMVTKIKAGGRDGDGTELLRALQQMFDWTPPTDPALAAQYEKETSGLRLICHYGHLLKKGYADPADHPEDEAVEVATEPEEQLIASDPDIATNCAIPPESASPPTQNTKNCCPDCHTPYTEVSEWYNPYASADELNQVRWFPLDQPPPG